MLLPKNGIEEEEEEDVVEVAPPLLVILYLYIVEGCTLIWRELGEALGLIFLLSWSVAKIPSIG